MRGLLVIKSGFLYLVPVIFVRFVLDVSAASWYSITCFAGRLMTVRVCPGGKGAVQIESMNELQNQRVSNIVSYCRSDSISVSVLPGIWDGIWLSNNRYRRPDPSRA